MPGKDSVMSRYNEGSGLIVASMRDNATDISLTPELLDAAELSVKSRFAQSNQLLLATRQRQLTSGTPLMDPDNITLRFVPDGPLDNSTAYQLIGTPGLEKQSDNKSIFQSNRSLRFTTHSDLDTIPQVLHLPFTGNANDLSGQQNDGTNYSAILSNEWKLWLS